MQKENLYWNKKYNQVFFFGHCDKCRQGGDSFAVQKKTNVCNKGLKTNKNITLVIYKTARNLEIPVGIQKYSKNIDNYEAN